MMTSSNWNIFRVIGLLCREFIGHRHRSFDVSFDQRLNKRLSKQPWGWWFETPSRSLWCHCNDATVFTLKCKSQPILGIYLNLRFLIPTSSPYNSRSPQVSALYTLMWWENHMMTSSNGNIFRVTGLCEENSPATGEFPSQRPVTRSLGVSFDLHLNRQLS